MKNNRRQFIQHASLVAAVPTHLMSVTTTSAAPNPGERIPIGQIGTTHAHASGKLKTLLKFSDQYKLVGVVEPDPQRRQALASNKTYKNVKWITEEQLLNTIGLRAVAVETEVKDLIATARRCIDAGVHIHLDKPAGTTYKDFANLVRAADAKKLTLQMGYMLRYNPAFTLMYQAVKEGWLGEIFSIHAEMSKAVNDESRVQLARYPGGAMFELGCHIIDSVVYLLGEPDNITTHALQSRLPKDDLIDNQLAVFDYPRANATLRAAVNEVAGQRRRQFVVMGTEGTLEIRPLESGDVHLTLSHARGAYKQGTHELKLGKGPGRYDGEFIDLAKIIRGQKQLAWNGQHDLATHRTLMRASGMKVK